MATALDDEEFPPPTGATAPPFIVQKENFKNILLEAWLPGGRSTPEKSIKQYDDTPLRYE
jgi:hypothetical protein